MLKLAHCFFEAAPGDRPSERAVLERVHELLATGLADARALWTRAHIDEAAFARYVGRHLRLGKEPLTALGHMNLVDMALASACLAGDPGALAEFEKTFRPAAMRSLRRAGRSNETGDEVWQTLCAHLFVGTHKKGPGLATYQGASPLKYFVNICAQRLSANHARADRARERLTERLAHEPVAHHRGPELSVLRHRYRRPFEAALRAALADLPRQDRNILRMRLVANLSVARIATMLGVAQATVSRRLDGIRQRVWAAVSDRLQCELGLASGELDSIARAVASQIDVAVSVVLTSKSDEKSRL